MAEDQIYLVQEGDCISSIAEDHGFFWKTLWDLNPALKQKRKNPNALKPGDEVKIPAKRIHQHSASADQKHTFVKKGTPAKIRLVVEKDDFPVKNKPYNLTIDGKVYQGQTDGNGLLEVKIKPNARQGTLEIEGLTFDLIMGGLDPDDEVSGLQDRLKNLGFYHGEINGQMDDETQDALKEFQSFKGLEATGENNDQTKSALAKHHDEPHAAPPQPSAAAEQSSASDSSAPAESPSEEGSEPPDNVGEEDSDES
jgi:hypothetical protein